MPHARRALLEITLLNGQPAAAASPILFMPRDFEVPATLETSEFRLHLLVVMDVDAVTTSTDHLRNTWPGGTWPSGLTLAQSLVDPGWHQHVRVV